MQQARTSGKSSEGGELEELGSSVTSGKANTPIEIAVAAGLANQRQRETN